jgi:hypothetical protein
MAIANTRNVTPVSAAKDFLKLNMFIPPVLNEIALTVVPFS